MNKYFYGLMLRIANLLYKIKAKKYDTTDVALELIDIINDYNQMSGNKISLWEVKQ